MKEEQIKKAVLSVAETEAGVLLFRALAWKCGFTSADIAVNRATGLVDPIATMLNVERRRLYLELRQYLPFEILQKIEFSAPMETKAETIKKIEEEK